MSAPQYTPEQIAQILAENAQLKSENEQQAQVIQEQHELAAVQTSNQLPVVADSKKKKYQVLAAKFMHPETKEVVAASALAKDKTLVDLLVSKNSGILKEIV